MRTSVVLLAFAAFAAWAQTCLVCGEIKSIREVHDRGPEVKERVTPGSPHGLDTGPVVGTVAQFHFGKNEGWSFGAAGTPEMQARLGETTYEITVAMDVGESRIFQRRDGNRYRVGQRVAVRAGDIEPM